MRIFEFFYNDYKARESLFNFIYNLSDQIIKIYLPINPNSPYHYSWVEGFTRIKLETNLVSMFRIIDVIGCLKNIPIKKLGKIIINVNDKNCTWNNKKFVLNNKDNLLKVEEITVIENINKKTNEISIDIEGFSYLVYGILPISEVINMNLIKNIEDDEIKILEKWFPYKIPWLTENF